MGHAEVGRGEAERERVWGRGGPEGGQGGPGLGGGEHMVQVVSQELLVDDA